MLNSYIREDGIRETIVSSRIDDLNEVPAIAEYLIRDGIKHEVRENRKGSNYKYSLIRFDLV